MAVHAVLPQAKLTEHQQHAANGFGRRHRGLFLCHLKAARYNLTLPATVLVGFRRWHGRRPRLLRELIVWTAFSCVQPAKTCLADQLGSERNNKQ